MKDFLSSLQCSCLFMLALFSTPVLAQHEGDLLVGRSAGNQLIVVSVPGEREINCMVPVLPNPFFAGWNNRVIGIDHVGNSADPNNGTFALSSGVNVHLKYIESEPGFHVVQIPFTGVRLDTPGETMQLGGLSQLHQHPAWNYNTNAQAGSVIPDGFAGRIKATFTLIDTGSTGYSESEPFTLVFSNDPNSPADVDGDGIVSTPDAYALAGKWLAEDCAHPDWCQRADIDLSGRVDWLDVSWIHDLWLDTQGCPTN